MSLDDKTKYGGFPRTILKYPSSAEFKPPILLGDLGYLPNFVI